MHFMLVVKNPHATQSLQVTIKNAQYNDLEGDSLVVRVAPGGLFVTTDVLPAGKVNVGPLTMEQPITGIEVFIVGS